MNVVNITWILKIEREKRANNTYEISESYGKCHEYKTLKKRFVKITKNVNTGYQKTTMVEQIQKGNVCLKLSAKLQTS